MTEKEYMALLKGIDEAEESTTPFPISTEDEIIVAGDANKTELNKHDFVVTFKIPTPDGYNVNKVEYKDVYITPRQEPRIIRLMVEIMPFYKKINEDGTTGKYTRDEVMKLVAELGESVYDKLYDLVGTVLGVEPSLRDYMSLDSVMYNAGVLLRAYPEMVNEASTFFQKSSDEHTIKAVK